MRYIIVVTERNDEALITLDIHILEYLHHMKMYIVEMDEHLVQSVLNLDGVSLVEKDGEVYAFNENNDCKL